MNGPIAERNTEIIRDKAVAWVKVHVPIFNVAESYGVAAFQAGYEAALEDQEAQQ